MPKQGVAFTFYTELVDAADTTLFKANPTLAAGDVQISLAGGAFANLATLPTVAPAGGTQVKVELTATEMAGVDRTVQFHDVVGGEWLDQAIHITADVRVIDDLATQASVDVVAGVVDAILVDTGTDIPASITALNDLNATDAADAVWDELIAGHLGAGTTGASLNAAGAAGDPWLTPLPGAYVAGTAGYIIGNCAVNIVNYIASHISAIGNLLRRRSSDLGCLYRGDTWTDTIGGLGDLSTATNIWVAFKKKSNDPDSAALLLVSMDVGLEVINQAPAAIPLNGSVGVVAPATGGFIDFYVHQDETAKLEPDKYHYDIQVETPYGAGSRIDTRRAGTVIIEGDIVRTTT